MNKNTVIIVAMVAVVLVGVGAFFGGAAYGKSQCPETADALANVPPALATRLAGRQGGRNLTPPDVPGAGQGITGTVAKIDGNTILLDTDQGPIKVHTTDTTAILKTVSVPVNELAKDSQVMVIGTLNDDGSVAARSVRPVDGAVANRLGLGQGLGGGQ